eukprot:TRINITY_DN3940_c0_g1_i1.p2 TRINITY_DN3940_c0_g1~~TRINITY_DN3940_c0_g1_i1.p2  ORF type:complete len:338 (-),score=65.36 TRINITY_DN3940_c0_g1_i1:13-1026(-)
MKLRVEVLQSITYYSPSSEGEPRLSARAMQQQSPHHSSNTTLFDTLYTQPYFDNTLEWFRAVAKGSPNYQANAPPFLDEALFLKVMTVLTMDDTGDDDILEIFDLLDRNNLGRIGFDEFFLIISLLAAKESGQCTKFLFQHGKAIFTLLSCPNAMFSSTSNELAPSPSTTRSSSSYVLQTPSSSSLQQTPHALTPLSPTITFERFSRFGTLLGISEHQLIEILNEQFGNQVSTSGGGMWLRYNDRKIDYDAFVMYYFALLDDFDQQKNPDRKQIFSEQQGIPTDEEEEDDEDDEVSEIEDSGSPKNIEHSSSSQSDKSEATEPLPQNTEKSGCCTIL